MRRLPLLLLASLCAWGCDTTASMPGKPLGTYAVSAKLSQNTCGADLGAPDPWNFNAEISRDDQQLHWRQGGPLIVSGPVDEAGQAKITSTQTGQSGQTGAGAGCGLGRTDTLLVKLGAGDPPGALSGQLTFAFTSDDAPACASQLKPAGGAYDALPCQLVYELSAEREK